MKNRAKVAAVLGAVALLPVGLVAIPAGASAIDSRSEAGECAIEKLPVPAGSKELNVEYGDPSGRYLVGRDSDYRFVLWKDGEVVERLELPSGHGFDAYDINGSGQIASSGWDNEGEHAYRYVDGEYTALPEPAHLEFTKAMGINENGDMVGIGYSYDNLTFQKSPLYWPADEPDTVRVLNKPHPGAEVTAHDISDSGAVIGNWLRGSYLWPDADSAPEAMPGSDGKDEALPREIVGEFAVGSDSTDGEFGMRGAVWNLETGEITTYKRDLAAVNAEGDVSLVDNWPAVIVRSDGGFDKLASLGADELPRNAPVVFDRDSELAAAGIARDAEKNWQPVVWRGC